MQCQKVTADKLAVGLVKQESGKMTIICSSPEMRPDELRQVVTAALNSVLNASNVRLNTRLSDSGWAIIVSGLSQADEAILKMCVMANDSVSCSDG